MNQNNFEPNHFGFDQPPQYTIDHQPPIMQEDLNQKLICDEFMTKLRNELFKAMQSMFEEFCQREQAANLRTDTSEPSRRFNFICYDDDDDDAERTIPLRDIISQLPPSIVITTSPPVLPTFKDPEDSLIMGNEDLSTIPEKESDEIIKSSVEDLDLIPCESGNPTPSSDSEVQSLSPSPILYEDSDPLLEDTNILLSYFDNSLPEYETFSFDNEEKSSGSTTTQSDYSLSDYEAFYLDDDHIEEKSNGSTTTHYDFLFLNMIRLSLIFQLIRFLLPIGVFLIMRSSPMNSLTLYFHQRVVIKSLIVDGSNVSNNTEITNDSNKDFKSSYVNIAKSTILDYKFTRIPTEIDVDGSEFVIFDEEIVKLGTPLIIDMVTTNMCKMGTDRVGFARVLIEVEAEKGLPNSIDIVFKDGENIVTVEEIEEMDKVKASKNEHKDDFVQVKSRKRAKNNVRKNGKNDMGKEDTTGNNVMCRLKMQIARRVMKK
uniref:Uncharacterized protein n=1 Tax=Tanacetum cinerariifolium TaxID=118510 RepID=A0A6L2JKW0_TANCI|nr:hypothetical protein [Tanacetum cinerariifolium]